MKRKYAAYLIYATTHMDLENMLNEARQAQMEKQYMIPLIKVTGVGKFIEPESRIEVSTD